MSGNNFTLEAREGTGAVSLEDGGDSANAE
jgi:hypothetical protein